MEAFESNQSIMFDIGLALHTDMMTSVNLEYQTVADEKVGPVAEDVCLRNNRYSQPTQSRKNERLETGVRVNVSPVEDSLGLSTQR